MGDAQAKSESRRDVLEIVSNSSLIDFLNNEENCESVDENKLFSEINRLASLHCEKLESESDDRTIEELLKEAETLINQPIGAKSGDFTISSESTPLEIRNGVVDRYDYSTAKSLSQNLDVSHSLFICLRSRYCISNDSHESHRLFACADNLISWEHKSAVSSVSKLNSV